MSIKFAFFDVDGTLSVPIFQENDSFVIGFSEEDWKKYCMRHKEDSYEYCKPVLPVKRYAQKLKEQDVKLYVLTTSGSKEETAAKEKFIRTHYAGLFEKVIAVDADRKKLDEIERIADSFQADLSECELVEDTFATLLLVNQYKIKVTHVSSLVCDL